MAPWFPLVAAIALLVASTARADNAVSTEQSPDDARIIDDCKRLTQASQESDADMIVDMTYAPYVKYWGGRYDFTKTLEDGFRKTQEANVTIVSSRVIPPLRHFSTELNDYVVVLTRTIMTIGDAKIQSDDCMLAIRPKGGGKWQYLGTAKLSAGLKNRLFPDLINVDFPDPVMKRLN